ncbi:hypothetical protein E2F50_02695 [Rhizobium deserti]|uniref:Uncharacterized protein n=1 Tax=Rhizobium deserti TaxID=2547961 RepID=A0A4R5UMJ9_9HYPH|nr:hypothetical protein [Rhizobium deserti]TDK39061.1 hypothetical protein E2F50_02695 [Rhizobium deserti]
MADRKSFETAVGEVGAKLEALRSALAASETMVIQAARDRQLPDKAALAAEQARQGADADERDAAEQSLAALISAFADRLEEEKRAFEDREVPSRAERLLGYFSRSTTRRLLERRWVRRNSLDRLTDLLRRADRLAGVLSEERRLLLAKHKSLESALAQFVDHRPEVMERLGDYQSAGERLQAVTAVEDFIRLSNALVRMLNRRVAVCNALLHKLTVDVEDLLILYRVVIEVDGKRQGLALDAQGFMHLDASLDRFRRGMLIGRDLERLREATETRFFSWFPTYGPQVAPEPASPPQD